MAHKWSGHHVSFQCRHHSHASTLHPNHMFLCLCFSVYPSPSSYFLVTFFIYYQPPASNCCQTLWPSSASILSPPSVSTFNYMSLPCICHCACFYSHNTSYDLLYIWSWRRPFDKFNIAQNWKMDNVYTWNNTRLSFLLMVLHQEIFRLFPLC